MKPFCAIYSTFFNAPTTRLCTMLRLGLPVRFALDRAVIGRRDGATMRVPSTSFISATNMVLTAAADELELMHMVATAATIDDRPCGLRFPRGEGVGLALPARGTPLGRGRFYGRASCVANLVLQVLACRNACSQGRRSPYGGLVHRGGRTLCQAARCDADRASGAPTRGTLDGRGGRCGWVRFARDAPPRVARHAGRRTEVPSYDVARPTYRPQQPTEAVRRGRTQRTATSSRWRWRR